MKLDVGEGICGPSVRARCGLVASRGHGFASHGHTVRRGSQGVGAPYAPDVDSIDTTPKGAGGARSPHESIWGDALGRTATRSAQVLLVTVLAALVVFAVSQLKLLVIPVIIAVIIAAAVSPVVTTLRRRGWPDAVTAWVAMLTGIGALGVVIWLVVRGFRREWSELVAAAEEGLDELEAWLGSGAFGISAEQVEQARQALVDFLTSDTVSSGAVSGAVVAAEVIAGIFLGLVVLFFLLKDGSQIWDFLVSPLRGSSHERARRIGDHAVGVLGGYVRGTAVVALVDAVVIGIALLILGVPLALPLATVVFLGAFVPLVGATLAGTLAALVALVANGPVSALIVVAVIIAVNQIEGDLLAPLVLGRAVRLHALAILLALTAGTILAGIIGALLAVPLTAVGWTVIREWRGVEDEPEEQQRPRIPRRRRRGSAPQAQPTGG